MERVASVGTSWERCYCTQVTLGELGLSIYTLRGFFFFFLVGFGPIVGLMVMEQDRVLAPEFAISMKHVR